MYVVASCHLFKLVPSVGMGVPFNMPRRGEIFAYVDFFGKFRIFVVSGQGKHAASIGTIRFFIGYAKNSLYPHNKNCVSLFKS